jgi:hypothetical protein
MELTYQSGEDIQRGDRVTYGGNAGTIELVVEGLTGDPETDWLFENHGAGIMVVEPRVFGRVYLSAPHDEEDVSFHWPRWVSPDANERRGNALPTSRRSS